MSTVAWIFILVAVVVMRGVAKGRVMDLPGDLRDMFIAGLRGDTDALKEVAGRTGTGLTVEPVQAATDSPDNSDSTSVSSNTLIVEARKLAAAAHNKYRWGATGPDAYDCSGLVWRVCVNQLGSKRVGSRFTTATFGKAARVWTKVVSTPQVGDIVVWNRTVRSGHMGFVVGPNRMFSALSTRSGIIESPISSESGTPIYYRVVG